jgi:acetyl/propionyl-CoA carboxylase alpha subunit
MPAILFDGKTLNFRIEEGAIVTDGKRIEFTILREQEGRLLVKSGNSVEEIVYSENGGGVQLFSGGVPRGFEVLSDRDLLLRSLGSDTSSHHAHSAIKAPMPGLVVRILVKNGDTVKRGTNLMILEAMKMENEIRTPVDAEVGEVLVRDGDIVEKDQVIVTLH